jgi:esterase/lipase superfamily enzyme
LYFCLFNYDKDSIYVKYRAENLSKDFPREPVKGNIFYKVFEDLYVKKGIRQFFIVIPGYSKTFHKQVYDYIYRLKEIYADTLAQQTVILTYAWGNAWRPDMYFRAKLSAKKGAHDFAIFQHMLEDFLTDEEYYKQNPYDISVNLMCSSMGNQLFKNYMKKREENGIPLVKIYDKIVFMASDASWDSFEEKKGFYNIHDLTDSVYVYVNTEDLPLQISQFLNPKPRMGLMGPKHADELPGYIRIFNITGIISNEDILGLGHDYLLRNPILREQLIHYLRETNKFSMNQ